METFTPEEDLIRMDLENLGAAVTKKHFTGDSSFPTEYTIKYKNILVCQPTIEMAQSEFVKKLMDLPPVESLIEQENAPKSD